MNNFDNIDDTIVREIKRDFRLLIPREPLPLVFADFLEWHRENPKVLAVVEWMHNVLDAKNGISIRTLMRILKKYSGVNVATQKRHYKRW